MCNLIINCNLIQNVNRFSLHVSSSSCHTLQDKYFLTSSTTYLGAKHNISILEIVCFLGCAIIPPHLIQYRVHQSTNCVFVMLCPWMPNTLSFLSFWLAGPRFRLMSLFVCSQTTPCWFSTLMVFLLSGCCNARISSPHLYRSQTILFKVQFQQTHRFSKLSLTHTHTCISALSFLADGQQPKKKKTSARDADSTTAAPDPRSKSGNVSRESC